MLLADVVDLADMRVMNARGGLRFPLEPLPSDVRRVGARDDLNRDGTIELIVVRLVDHTHPALSEQADDAIAPDPVWKGHRPPEYSRREEAAGPERELGLRRGSRAGWRCAVGGRSWTTSVRPVDRHFATRRE